MPSLYTELTRATRLCPITQKQYIPSDEVNSIITLEKVKEAALRSRLSWMCLRFRNRNFDKEVLRAKRVIAIITLIDKLNEVSLKYLTTNGLTDEDLPLSQNEDGTALKCCRGTKTFSFPAWTDASIGIFLRNQWTVLSPILSFKVDQPIEISLDEDCGLEFSSCVLIEETQFSQIYEAELPRVNNEEPMRIAVKKFPKDGFKSYSLERDNLGRISSINNPHLIKHLATCEQVPCIIFPWAESGDLNLYWKNESASQRTYYVFSWALEQLAGLASALKDLHSINCRHGDLKPSNILYFKERDVRILKIADLGVSRVHNQATDLRKDETVTKASTRAYEGPEAYRPDQTKSPRSRTYDCWSMGCIILEFVIWLLYSNRALECFKGSRDSEWHGYYRPKPQQTSSDSEAKEWWQTMERHPVVDEAIKALREDKRVTGTVLEKLVDLVDLRLLMIRPKKRLLASGINEELQGLLSQFNRGNVHLVNDAECPPVPQIFSELPQRVPESTSPAFNTTSTFPNSTPAMNGPL